jgi:aldose 1-epimerase
MTAPRPASGEQYRLRSGAVTAQVGEVAAVLRSFAVDGVPFTETWDDAVVPPMGCGIVLVPWPNRIPGGRWTLGGKEQQLDITDVGHGAAIHGLLRNTAYRLVERTESSVTQSAPIYPQHGYPFTLDTQVTHAVSANGLTVTHRLTNAGADAAPFGVGVHPYLRVGERPVSELTVTVSADRYLRLDESLVPVAVEPVDGTRGDLRAGASLAELDLDVALTGLRVADGRVEHRLSARDGTGLLLWADEVFGWAQVYSPPNFPGPGAPDRRRAVAIEPMTCAPNAFNSGDGLRWLEPGESWSASWGLRPFGF